MTRTEDRRDKAFRKAGQIHAQGRQRGALAIFNEKIGSVCKVVDFRGRHGGLSRNAIDDIRQEAALVLWRECLKAADPNVKPFDIDCGLMALAGYMYWRRKERRMRFASLDAGWQNARDGGFAAAMPARRGTIQVDGVTLNSVDARLDAPTACEHFEGRLLSTKEAADRLGVTRARAHQLTKRLGAVRIGRGRWGFPLAAVLAYKNGGASRRRRQVAG